MSDVLPLLEVRGLRVSFPTAGGGRFHAADGVDLSLYPNQTLAVVGESGSGKSVSAMSVLKLIPTPPGRYESGQTLLRTSPDAEARDTLSLRGAALRAVRGGGAAMIFQEPMTSLNPVYTIGEQLVEAVRLHRQLSLAEARTVAVEALRSVGIGDAESRLAAYPHQASGGMRQRYMIAMALACEPAVLLADEPTTALDVTIQAQILELLRGLQRDRGMGMMLITHDLGVVAETADTVAVMFAGRVVEFADVYTLFERPLHPYTRGLLMSMPSLGGRGEAKPRLATVMDGATLPDDLPAGVTVRPHDPTPASSFGPGRRYGGDHALREVEPGHWLLCGGPMTPTPPRLAFRRE